MGRANKDEETPLWIASQQGRLEVVKVLLEAKAEVDRVDAQGFTPLIMATQRGKLVVVRVLLAAGADKGVSVVGPDGTQYTPLSLAEAFGHTAVAELLRGD